MTALVDQLKGARRPHLPHLGAHLRLQPRVRALPVVVGSARPARADDRRGQGRPRRARAPAGVLHQHRRRRADDPARLLRARRVLDRQGHRRQVLHQRRLHRRRQGPPPGRRSTTSTSRSASTAPTRRDQRRRAWRRLLRHGDRAMDHLRDAGFVERNGFKISVVVTRHNVDQLDEFKALADSYGAQLRITRLRPSGRGADVWHDLHPTNAQQRQIYHWLLAHGDVLTGDSFFHLNALGDRTCRAQPVRGRPGRVPDRPDRRRVRLPVRDPRRVPRRQRARRRRVHPGVAQSDLFRELREPQSAGRARRAARTTPARAAAWPPSSSPACPLDGPDPECVGGDGELALAGVATGSAPRPMADHSKPPRPVPVSLGRK
jgi:hypothetical protein